MPECQVEILQVCNSRDRGDCRVKSGEFSVIFAAGEGEALPYLGGESGQDGASAAIGVKRGCLAVIPMAGGYTQGVEVHFASY